MLGNIDDIMLKSTTERDSSLDLIKFISILMVIVLHVSSNGFTSSESRLWNGANFFESFTRVCVPLFFMTTGALLGNLPCTFQSSFSRIKRIAIPLIFWSVAYLIFFHFLNNQKLSFLGIISKPAAGHLWYLYALIGVYITLPLLSILMINTDQRQKYYILFLWFVSCIALPSMKSYGLVVSSYLDLSSIGLYQGYFLCGAIIAKARKTRTTRTIAVAIYLLMSLMIMLFTKVLFDNEGLNDVRNYLNSSVFVCLASVSAFFALHGIRNIGGFTGKFIDMQLKYIFGIYLFHLSLIYIMGAVGLSISSSNVYYFIPLASITIYLMSLVACYLIHKIGMKAVIS